MPRVSVIIPAYNQDRYLGDAIRSALEQTCDDLEVIVVDDGSTDRTRDVACGFLDRRVRYTRQDNGGLSAARNTGIRHATGTFLAYLDSDDQFLPDKIEVLLKAFDRHPQTGLVAGHAILIDEQGRRLGERFERDVPAEPTEWLLGNPLHVGSVMLRREWQDRVGLFDETLRSYEDWDMWVRLARAGCEMRSVRHPVSLYRFHGLQMTRIGSQMTTATFAVLDKVFADPDLPPAWRSRRDQAYSGAYLRAAAQAYTARDYPSAMRCLSEAVRLDPSLAAEHCEPIARIAAGWANHVKTAEPLRFLEGVYSNLPDELAALRRRRRQHLAREALHLAWTAWAQNDREKARARGWQALALDPSRMFSRGLLSMLIGWAHWRHDQKPETTVAAATHGSDSAGPRIAVDGPGNGLQ